MTYGEFFGTQKFRIFTRKRNISQKGEFLAFQKTRFLGVSCRKLSLNKIGVMDMSYIMDSGLNRLKTTLPNIFLLISADSADLPQIQKNHFSKKIHDFLIENLL